MGYVPHFHDDPEKLAQEFLEIIGRIVRRFRIPGVDDTVQQIFLELWQKRDAVLSHPNPTAFIACVARGRTLDMLRSDSRRLRQEVSLAQWDERASANDTESTAAPHSTRMPGALTVPHPIERHMELEEAKRRVAEIAAVVRGLSRKQRRIFGQCIVRKRPQQEVAEELGMSYGTLRNEVARLKKLLRAAGAAVR